jgi:hypothetical protein
VFTDGITNKLLGCFHEESPEDVVLVRVYGHKTDLLIDRNSETRNIQVLLIFFIILNSNLFSFNSKKNIGYEEVNWVHLALINMAMNLWVLLNKGNLSSRATIRFSRTVSQISVSYLVKIKTYVE